MAITYLDRSNKESSGTKTSSRIEYLDRPDEIKQDYPVRRALSEYLIRPAVIGGAMTAGGAAGTILGAPAGPVGSAAGGTALAAAMYPPANRFANAIDERLGIAPRPKPESEFNRVADELTTGLMTETGGAILGKIPGVVKSTVKGAVPTLFGPSREAVAARMSNPEAIRNAPSYGQLAENLPKTLKNISGVIDRAYKNATSHLRSSPQPQEGAVPVSQLSGILGNLQEGLKVGETNIGSSDKAATQKIFSLIGDLDNIIKRQKPVDLLGPSGRPIQIPKAEAYIPEDVLHKAIQRIRKDINFDDKSASVTNSLLTDVSGQLDSLLKKGNLQYQKSMRPVSTLMRVYNDAKSKFGLTQRTGEGIQSTDQTISSLKTLPSERRGISQKTMQRIGSITGEDYTGASKNRALAEQFMGGNAQGTRRVAGFGVAGTALGTGLGHLVGAPSAGATMGSVVGAIAGMASDISGREIGAKVVDAYLRAVPGLARIPYQAAARVIAGMVKRDEETQ